MNPRTFALVVAAIWTLAAPFRLAAAQEQRCWLDKEFNKHCVIETPGGPGVPGGTVESRLDYTPYKWVSQEFDGVVPVFGQPPCPPRLIDPPPTDPTVPRYETATHVLIWLEHVETGQRIGLRAVCVYPGEDPPAPPPSPPTPGDVLHDIAALLQLDTNYWPRVTGLTGLESKFWCTVPSTPDIDTFSLSGWTVESSVGLVGIAWDIAGPETLKVPGGADCGSEAHPSGRWMPNALGDYDVTALGTWGGTYTISYSDAYFNITAGPIDMGTVTLSGEPVPYEVIEHVGVLVD